MTGPRPSKRDQLQADLERAWLAVLVGMLGLGLSLMAFALGWLWVGGGL